MLLQRPCPGCGGSSVGAQGRRAGAVCRACLADGQPVGQIRGLPGLDRCGALYRYRGAIRRTLVAGKFQARRDGLVELGLLLGNLAGELGFEFDVVTWVPASPAGRRNRGYDQGRLLAVALSRRTGVPPRRLLARSGRHRLGRDRQVSGDVGRSGDGRQTGRDRAQRLSGPAFRAVRPAGGRVLVVDDVITTGASIVGAAARLRAAGASAVLGLAVAWTASDCEVAAGRPLPQPWP